MTDKKRIYGEITGQVQESTIQNEYNQKLTIFDKGSISTVTFGGQTFDIFNPNSMNQIMTELGTYKSAIQSMMMQNSSLKNEVFLLKNEVNILRTELSTIQDYIKRAL